MIPRPMGDYPDEGIWLDPAIFATGPEDHSGLCVLCGRASGREVCDSCEQELEARTLHHKDF